MKSEATTPTTTPQAQSERAQALADRLLEGARRLGAFAAGLSEKEWDTPLPGDGRKVGVVVHHVASVYPVETQLAVSVTSGKPVAGVTMDDIHAMNAAHAHENAGAAKEPTLELLRQNSAAAAHAIRQLSAEDLDRAVPVSLYSDAVVTCQFVLEDHAVRHSYHHLAGIKRALSS